MSTKELMKYYSKMPKKVIDKTNFITISTYIRITKERENVLSAGHLFINGGMLKGVGLNDTDSLNAKNEFKFFLLSHYKSLAFLVTIAECELTSDFNTILLCTEEEMKAGYMYTIQEVFFDLFHYPILTISDSHIDQYDKKDVIKRILYYKKKIKKIRMENMSDADLVRYIQKLSDKELKKELKKRDEEYKGLDRTEMELLLHEVW